MPLRALASGLALCVLLLHPTVVSALGLGRITVKSKLNEPFLANISLLNTRGLNEEQITARLADNEAFERASVERTFALSQLKFDVSVNSRGTGVIRITSRERIVEPFLNFLVEVRSPNGNVVREYTILLELPEIGGSVAEEPVSEPEIEDTVLYQPGPDELPPLEPKEEPVAGLQPEVVSRETYTEPDFVAPPPTQQRPAATEPPITSVVPAPEDDYAAPQPGLNSGYVSGYSRESGYREPIRSQRPVAEPQPTFTPESSPRDPSSTDPSAPAPRRPAAPSDAEFESGYSPESGYRLPKRSPSTNPQSSVPSRDEPNNAPYSSPPVSENARGEKSEPAQQPSYDPFNQAIDQRGTSVSTLSSRDPSNQPEADPFGDYAREDSNATSSTSGRPEITRPEPVYREYVEEEPAQPVVVDTSAPAASVEEPSRSSSPRVFIPPKPRPVYRAEQPSSVTPRSRGADSQGPTETIAPAPAGSEANEASTPVATRPMYPGEQRGYQDSGPAGGYNGAGTQTSNETSAPQYANASSQPSSEPQPQYPSTSSSVAAPSQEQSLFIEDLPDYPGAEQITSGSTARALRPRPVLPGSVHDDSSPISRGAAQSADDRTSKKVARSKTDYAGQQRREPDIQSEPPANALRDEFDEDGDEFNEQSASKAVEYSQEGQAQQRLAAELALQKELDRLDAELKAREKAAKSAGASSASTQQSPSDNEELVVGVGAAERLTLMEKAQRWLREFPEAYPKTLSKAVDDKNWLVFLPPLLVLLLVIWLLRSLKRALFGGAKQEDSAAKGDIKPMPSKAVSEAPSEKEKTSAKPSSDVPEVEEISGADHAVAATTAGVVAGAALTDDDVDQSTDELDDAGSETDTDTETETETETETDATVDALSPAPKVEEAIEQADTYLAYGRYEQANEVLESALEAAPSNLVLRQKLLQVAVESENKTDFAAQFAALEEIAEEDDVASVRQHLASVDGAEEYLALVSGTTFATGVAAADQQNEEPLEPIENAPEAIETPVDQDIADAESAEFDTEQQDALETGADIDDMSDSAEATVDDEPLSEEAATDTAETGDDESLGFGFDDAEDEAAVDTEQSSEAVEALTADQASDDADEDLDLLFDLDDEPSDDETGSISLQSDNAEEDDFAGFSMEDDEESDDGDEVFGFDLEDDLASDDETTAAVDEVSSTSLNDDLQALADSTPASDADDDSDDLSGLDLSALDEDDDVELSLSSSDSDSDELDTDEFSLDADDDDDLSIGFDLDDDDDLGLGEDDSELLIDDEDTGSASATGADEIATKLELGEAYMGMGDIEGAREMLEEVVSEGDASQQQKARALLQQLEG